MGLKGYTMGPEAIVETLRDEFMLSSETMFSLETTSPDKTASPAISPAVKGPDIV